MTTGNAPTIEEQIAYQEQLLSNYQINPVVTLIGQSIRDSLKKLAAIESQPVPVEPESVKANREAVKKYGVSSGIIEYIDALQSALKRAQEKKIFAETMLKDYRGAFTMQQERAEKAEAINRRMVEQYRDLVVAAEKIGGKVTDASNLQISIADVLSMKEALAKLEES